MLGAIKDIEIFLRGTDYKKYESDKMTQSACIHQLQIIGEAANHFSDEFIYEHKEIEWAEIIGLRNLLIHEYFGIDIRIVWQVIQNDLPRLKTNIQKILKEISS
ncbi:DUF86 domain-containing protein [bacterium]|nr:DUF86 domain-containing protein [bacterium]